MKTLILYLKITTFLLLIWMYQCFYNCDSYKTLIDKNILQTKNKIIYERVLTEGDIAGEKQTYGEECIGECPLDNEKNKWENPVQCENPCDQWHNVIIPSLWEDFNKETSEMDPKLKEKKWNVEWNQISANKVNDLSSIYHRQDISEEEKKKKIYSVMNELISEYVKFLYEFKKEMRVYKKESESKKEIRDNKTESESNKEMRENKTEFESNKKIRDHKSESESMKKMRDNKTESESMKEMIDNKAKSESEKETINNKTESEYEKEITDNNTKSESEKEMRDNKTESESESEKEMRDNKKESESTKEKGTNEIKNYKKKISKLIIVLIFLRRIEYNGLTENIGGVMHKI
ncbi:fam-g protein [Plasmodium gallinaceum]|uniref:Fam-g protein n=1 Tax=Plasmodium gallinaceum TaxID=5849 RepID=A0A1J1GPQ6_PLAGA|nr:fam-g protein [Plasmodium gallinaceum]CRG94490.1 fam-g protein [Plasmodium gallinaceum]